MPPVNFIQSNKQLTLFLTFPVADLKKSDIVLDITSRRISLTISSTAPSSGGETLISGTFVSPIAPQSISYGTSQAPGGTAIWVTAEKATAEIWSGPFSDASSNPSTSKVENFYTSIYRMVAHSQYERGEDNELAFGVGDIVDVISEDPSEWFMGVANGFYGMFPSNFCTKEVQQEIGLCMASMDYEAQEENELTFFTGDIIKILAKDPSGWWEGELNGKNGWFPSNFVEIHDPKNVRARSNSGGPKNVSAILKNASTKQQTMRTVTTNQSVAPRAQVSSPRTGLSSPSSSSSSASSASSASSRLTNVSKGRARGPTKKHSATRGKRLGEGVKTWDETETTPGAQTSPGTQSQANVMKRAMNPMAGMMDLNAQLNARFTNRPNKPAGLSNSPENKPGAPQRPTVSASSTSTASSGPSTSPAPTSPMNTSSAPTGPAPTGARTGQPTRTQLALGGNEPKQLPKNANPNANPLKRPNRPLNNSPLNVTSKSGGAAIGSPTPTTTNVLVTGGGGGSGGSGGGGGSNMSPSMSANHIKRASISPMNSPANSAQNWPSSLPEYSKFGKELATLLVNAKIEGNPNLELGKSRQSMISVCVPSDVNSPEKGPSVALAETVSIPLTLFLVKEVGEQMVGKYVSLNPGNNKPFILFSVEGFIALCSILVSHFKKKLNTSDHFVIVQPFIDCLSRLCASPIGFKMSVYKNMKHSSNEVFARAFLMKSRNQLCDHSVHTVMKVYCLLSALQSTAKQAAALASSIANEEVLPPYPKLFSILSSSGIARECTNKIPSLSSRSGLTLMIVPKLVGIALYIPQLCTPSNPRNAYYNGSDLTPLSIVSENSNAVIEIANKYKFK